MNINGRLPGKFGLRGAPGAAVRLPPKKKAGRVVPSCKRNSVTHSGPRKPKGNRKTQRDE